LAEGPLPAERSVQHEVLLVARSVQQEARSVLQEVLLVVARSAQHEVLLEAALLPSALQALEYQVPERLDAVALGAAVQLRPVAVAHVVGEVSW